MANKKVYTLTITYEDGMVARFDETAESLLYSMAQRIQAYEQNPNVKSWTIEPRVEWTPNE